MNTNFNVNTAKKTVVFTYCTEGLPTDKQGEIELTDYCASDRYCEHLYAKNNAETLRCFFNRFPKCGVVRMKTYINGELTDYDTWIDALEVVELIESEREE